MFSGRKEKVLVSTLPPRISGGAQRMLDLCIDALGPEYELEIAHYEPYSLNPRLSVPLTRLASKRDISTYVYDYRGIKVHAFGAWLPEFEFTHYLPTKPWRDLVQRFDGAICLGGNVLPALPFVGQDMPVLAWVASSYAGDRRDRVRAFPWYRKLLDAVVIRPVSQALEKTLLHRFHVSSISEYTRRELEAISPNAKVVEVIPVPVNMGQFNPQSGSEEPWNVGFIGRLNDPRKNVRLLLDAVASCQRLGRPVQLHLAGAVLDSSIESYIEALGIRQSVESHGHIAEDQLPAFLRKLDVFIVPSWQEGLCIAALEAMACGCPVIATRCGGVEDFVVSGENGYLVGFEKQELVDTIGHVCGERALRQRLSQSAVATIRNGYETEQVVKHFTAMADRVFRR
jgi:glycosyltransferase involved in cell wall biosynthesis